MDLDVWIDFDDDSMKAWKGGAWAKDTAFGELAMSRSPFFPEGHEAFYKVTDLINSKRYETDYIDEITRYVIIPKSKLVVLIKSLKSKWNMDHIEQRLDELLAFVETLPDNRNYKVVCQEF